MSSQAVSRSRLGMPRALVGLAGLALLGLGAWIFVTDVSVNDWLRVVIWLAGGVAVHDGVIAPSAVALGRLWRDRAPVRVAPVIRVAGLAALTVVLLAIPLLATGGVGR